MDLAMVIRSGATPLCSITSQYPVRPAPAVTAHFQASIALFSAGQLDPAFAHLPVRQWVLSVLKRLRCFMQRDGAALSGAMCILLRVVGQRLLLSFAQFDLE